MPPAVTMLHGETFVPTEDILLYHAYAIIVHQSDDRYVSWCFVLSRGVEDDQVTSSRRLRGAVREGC